jgi:hypothetical protein
MVIWENDIKYNRNYEAQVNLEDHASPIASGQDGRFFSLPLPHYSTEQWLHQSLCQLSQESKTTMREWDILIKKQEGELSL